MAIAGCDRRRRAAVCELARNVDLCFSPLVWIAWVSGRLLVHVQAEDRVIPDLFCRYYIDSSRGVLGD